MKSMRKLVFIAALVLAAPASGQPQDQQPSADGPFIIFFDWAKPEITSDAAAILDKVAEGFALRPGAQLMLAGHSDRSGPAAFNVVPSRRRAEAVRDYLSAHGVPASAISISAHGEARPIVPTEDGVREVQNRRVEISFVN